MCSFFLCPQMSQELGIMEKSPDFINPYRTERDDVSKRCSLLCIIIMRMWQLSWPQQSRIPLLPHSTHSHTYRPLIENLSPTFSHFLKVLHTAEAFQKILREEEKRRRKEEKRKEIRKGPRISRSRTEL